MNRPPHRLATGLVLVAPIPAAIAAAIGAGAVGIAAAIVSIAIAIAAVSMLHRRPAAPSAVDSAVLRFPDRTPPPDATLKRLRHDLRGALSPALLTTDRLLSSADPATQRSGAIISESIERAIALVDDTRPGGPAL